MTLAASVDAPPVDRRTRAEGVAKERRGRERRGSGRLNKVAPRASRLQFLGAIATAIGLSGMTLLLLGTYLLHAPIPWGGLGVMGAILAMAVLSLIMGTIEQRLIEIRLELMMLNGGQRKSDRTGTAADRRA